MRYPRPSFLCGGVSSRAARTGRSRSGSGGRSGRSLPQASRIPGRLLPASWRARRLRGTQKRQPKTSCLFSMRKARRNARDMTFYMRREIFFFIMPPVKTADGRIAAALFLQRVLKLTVSPPFECSASRQDEHLPQSVSILPGFPGRRNIHPVTFPLFLPQLFFCTQKDLPFGRPLFRLISPADDPVLSAPPRWSRSGSGGSF